MTHESVIPPAEAAKLPAVADLLRRCRSVLFITGAGMSADSGLPTYRGIGGLYNHGRTAEGLAIEEALSGEVFAVRPEITWRHLLDIERACRKASFNRGHEVLAEMEKRVPRLWILTQNVDGFHRAAGSTRVIDIHGDMHQLACTRCDYQTTVADYSGLDTIPPPCPHCRAVLRPKVVLFGEMLPADKLSRLQAEIHRGFDAVVSIGTTSVFPYISGPVARAKQAGIPTVEINPSKTQVSDLVDIKIAAGAALALDAVWALVRREEGEHGAA